MIKCRLHIKYSGRLFCFFLALFFHFHSWSRIKIYDSKVGLSENTITAISKDNRGFIWIGTKNGLNIFDGYTFSKIQGNLNSSSITQLLFDKEKDLLWVGTTQGLFCVNTRSFQSTKINHLGSDGKREGNYVVRLYQTKINKPRLVIAAFGNGQIVAVTPNRKVKLLADMGADAIINCHFAEYRNGDLFIHAQENFKYEVRNGALKKIPNFKTDNIVSSISVYNKDTLIVSNYYNGIFLYDLETSLEFRPDFLNFFNTQDKSIVIAEKVNNEIYISSAGGYEFYKVSPSSKEINISLENENLFAGKRLTCLFSDEPNIIWIGTNKGLVKYEEQKHYFQTLLFNKTEKASTRNIIEDENGDLFVGSYNGLYQYAHKEDRWYLYNSPGWKKTGQNDEWNEVLPFALVNDPTGNYIYIGLESSSFIRFDKRLKKFEIGFYQQDKNADFFGIYTLARNPDGTIWLGTGNGLGVYEPSGRRLFLNKGNIYDIGNHIINHLVLSKDMEELFIATNNGLFIINKKKQDKLHFNSKSKIALSNDEVFCVYEDSDGKLWLGTNGGGLNILSQDRDEISQVKKENGLSNDIVYGILGEGNYLWASTFDGLTQLNVSDGKFVIYSQGEGLSSDEFNKGSFLKSRDGKMYFGGINGINCFYPQRLLSIEQARFHVFLSAITKWDNHTKTINTIRNVQDSIIEITKRPSDPLIELHLACSDYTDPTRNKYLYRIKGLYNNWISLGNNHLLNLGGIPYGNYEIEVKAMNARGITSDNILKIKLKILLPFYKRGWFLLLIFLLVAVSVWIAYLLKVNRLKSLIAMRMRIASNLHDEVGSLLTRITMFSDNLRYGNNTKEQQHLKLDKIARLSRDATTSMSDVLWTIDGRNDFAGSLTDRMKEHAEDMLLSEKIELIFNIHDTKPKLHVRSELRRNVYLIFKEAINNIVKHAPEATVIEVNFSLHNNHLFLQISNDGVEARPKKTASGQGLENMKMRAKKIGAEIDMQYDGNKFTIQIIK